MAHNANSYDINYILQSLGEESVRKRTKYLRCTPDSSLCKLKELRLNSFVFRDSLQYLPASLDACIQGDPYQNLLFQLAITLEMETKMHIFRVLVI